MDYYSATERNGDILSFFTTDQESRKDLFGPSVKRYDRRGMSGIYVSSFERPKSRHDKGGSTGRRGSSIFH